MINKQQCITSNCFQSVRHRFDTWYFPLKIPPEKQVAGVSNQLIKTEYEKNLFCNFNYRNFYEL